GLRPPVEPACSMIERAKRRIGRINPRMKVRSKVRKPKRARKVYQVSDDRARRRHLTRARSYKHYLAHRASAYEYCVVGAFHRGQQVTGGYKHRLCADVETAFAAASQTYQLDAIAKLLLHLDVQIGDARYALAVNPVAVYKLSESARGWSHDLVGH